MSQRLCAIRVENVSKKFGLTLQQSMKYGLQDVISKLIKRSNTSDILRPGEFWAVNNVSFTVNSGEALGIMGLNGCGKTTLLRMLNGVYAPDAGRIQMRGRVGALIAAGAGFAPMLSGRENIYVNGALLGLTTKEINALLDEIIAFSDLEKFIDLPVKNYSSGMYVRLGFAIAALSKPDVLLIDEVLAVGDFNFQKKCFEHILHLKNQGTAIILISHAPAAVWVVCDKGMFMDNGCVWQQGSVEDTVRAYEDRNSRHAMMSINEASKEDNSKGGTGDFDCKAVRLLCVNDTEKKEFDFRESIVLEAEIEVKYPQEDILFRLIVNAVHYRFIATVDSYEQGFSFPSMEPGYYRLRIQIHAPNFRPGAYAFNFFASKKKSGVCQLYWNNAVNFIVKSPTQAFLYSEPNAVMHLDSSFELSQQRHVGSRKMAISMEEV